MHCRGLGLLLAAAVGLVAPTARAKDPTLEEILRPPTHELLTISPTGRYIAATMRIKGRMMLAIINRETLKAERLIDPEERGDIARVEWAGPERVFVMNSRRGYRVEQAYLEPYVVAINVDGTQKRTLTTSILDTLIDDDGHMLVEKCGRSSSKGCWTYVEKVGVDGVGSAQRIADAPAINASFLADNAGDVRFSFVTDDGDIQKLWMRKGDGWTLVNDEAVSGVEVAPIGRSRDGRWGYLLSERPAGPDVIERLDMQGGQRETVLADPRMDPEYIVWSADGREPIGAAYGAGTPRARFWDAAHPDAVLMRQLEAAFPDDEVRFGSGSRDGQFVIVTVASDRDPGSFYLLDRKNRTSALIARTRPWIGPDELSPATPVAFRARDGLELTGYLTLPLRPAGAKPPLVVLPHGGPFDIKDDWAYDEETQILAAHGYAVLRVNFRGSAGYGRAFTRLGYREWGRKMQDDLTDATRWAIGRGDVDPARTCIWGTSYGGYAALMGAALEPELYRCAVASAAPTDLTILWRWGDTHRSKYGRVFLEEAVGKDANALLAVSPISYAGKIRPALMLAHGVLDDRVAFENARQMTAALERAGKPFVGYFPKNETHGVYGQGNREAYYGRVLDFLAEHLGGRRAAGKPTP
ncbi:alpha/beta hydrolase family protein [Cognatilysobacter segetis]|uniref:alpha/beta hydrolase family protein n=1 Tax=Cognatilysobacter segetis TaxID=2492394 RepID=UPI0013901440|nr:prolyl oligopeptidase family serine peptidase [Lysobacter segetis]